jgi:UrcA family protein
MAAKAALISDRFTIHHVKRSGMTMKTSKNDRIAGRACLALALGALASSAALAAEPQVGDITVRAERATVEKVGRTSSGVPIRQYELGYTVSYGDLDLASEGGASALKQRVHEAAQSACADLDKLYPMVPPDRDCARNAEKEAAPEIDAAIEAARKR